MSAWQTPAEAAATALRHDDESDVVETVLAEITEPDGDMLDAGARAIEDAFPIQISRRARRNLAGKIWRAMFDRVHR